MDALENKIHRKESNETFAILLNIAIRNVMEDFLSCDVKKKTEKNFFIIFADLRSFFVRVHFFDIRSMVSKGGTLRGGGYFYRFFISLPRILQLKYPSILMKV